jgi:predicted ATPase/DNA-binding SARP family transcriptional activator
MSRLALYLLGPPRFELDGEPIHISRRKAVALQAYLAMTKQSHRRDSLTALLWPEYDHSRARADLRRTLSVLNRTLGSGWLKVDRETAGLNWDADVWLDVLEFQARLTERRKHNHPPDQTCPACLTSLADAVSLYRDDFLAGFTLRDSPGFDDWQFFQTQELRDDLARALERLARGHGEGGELEPAIAYARQWVALDPLHEPAHRLLMQLYTGSGQRAAALRQYEECERVLGEELGLPPEEATTLVFQAIKESRELPVAKEPAALPTAPSAAIHRHNLPVQLTPFVGREDALAEIAERLDDPACRLLTLVGSGGSGKTRLALEAGAAQLERFAHGVFFASLAPLGSIEGIVPTVASALGLSFHAGPEPQQQLLDYLRQKAVLLIMDNFEHLLDGVGLVAEMLRAAPEVKILVTSRARLNVEGETLFRVAGMRFPRQDALPDALQYSAVKLYLQSARRIRPGFELRDDNLSDVVQICRLVQGLPLAVVLAAAWVEVLTPAEIADQISGEIGQSLDFLETDVSDVPERLRSMRAVFDHSWCLLTEREREVMRALSVFRGDFTRQAAERIAGASLRELKGLADKSMLQRTPAPSGPLRHRGRYELHELLRQYAAEKLAQRPDAWERAHDCHSTYYTTAMQGWREDLVGGPQQRRALAEVEADIENARAAWNWAVERHQVPQLQKATNVLCQFYVWRRRSQELEASCRLAVDRLTPAEPAGEQRVLAQVLAWQGKFLPNKADARLVNRSLALVERLELAGHDVRPEKAFALLRLGELAWRQGHPEKSTQLLRQSLDLYRALGDSSSVAGALEELGVQGWHQGDHTLVKQCAEESLTIRRSLDDSTGMGVSLLNLGWAALLRGHLREAERYHQQSLASGQELGLYRETEVGLLYLLGTTYSVLGRFTEARSLLQEGLDVSTETGLWGFGAILHSWLGLSAEMHLGRYQEARTWGEVGLRTSQELDYRRAIGLSHLLLGCVALARKEDKALGLLDESVAVHRGSGLWYGFCQALAALGMAAIARGDRTQAVQVLREALQIVAETGSFLALGWVIPGVVAILLDQGQTERAVELYAMASSHYPFVVESRWFEDVIGQRVAAAAAALPPAVVEAAHARGEVRDPAETVRELLVELGRIESAA